MMQEHTITNCLTVRTYNTAALLGKAAAKMVADILVETLGENGHANLLLATGASQFDFLKTLKSIDSIDWSLVTIFHLDEYIGIRPDHPASFRKYLHERIIDEVQPGASYLLNGDAKDIQNEVARYTELLKTHPIDIACIGIGENGHIAFNEPSVADFHDPQLVKIVEPDERSRLQQVGEGWFDSLEDVPRQSFTITIPAIMRAKTISCVVPEQRKAEAVRNTLYGPVSTQTPASALRTHPDATLFLDKHSASKLKEPFF